MAISKPELDSARPQQAESSGPSATPAQQPTLAEIASVLAEHADRQSSVRAKVIEALIRERGWTGRATEVLSAFAADDARLAYLSGGRRAEEIVEWLAQWVDVPLSIEEIRLVLAGGGWDPEPFVAVARAGLLRAFLYLPDGTLRRIRGELAGGWLSDEFALASDEEMLTAVRAVVDSQQQDQARR